MPIAPRRPRSLAALPVSALVLAATVAPGRALEVTRTADIAAPPAKVWQAIGDFCGIGDWLPRIDKCALSDRDGLKVRTLDLKGGGAIKEEQLSRDDKVMSYTSAMLESPLPVSDYKSTLAVAPEGSGSKVTWSATFNAKGAPDATAVSTVQSIYESGLKSLADRVK